jgi:cytochrome P450
MIEPSRTMNFVYVTSRTNNVQDMFAAATDTTYTTLVWAMAELINHPHEMRKVQGEIRAAVGGGGDSVTEDHLPKLRYLKCVIKETFRLRTPVPLLLPRETMEDTELLGYHVPARTRVIVNAWAIARDPAAWERPEEFVPERFAGDDLTTDYLLGQDFRFVPFGAGRRGCPGIGFAVPSMELALASLLYHFDWELPAGGPSKLEMDELNGLSVRLKATLNLVAKPWSPR